MLLVGSTRHLEDLDRSQTLVHDAAVTALAVGPSAAYALLDAERVVRVGEYGVEQIAEIAGHDGQALVVLPGGDLVVGLAGARLSRVAPTGEVAIQRSFEQVAGRADWENPAGPTPDLRSLATGAEGRLFVNVHVGGLWSSDDGGANFEKRIPPDADVHEVASDAAGRVVVAAAQGFGWSTDNGSSWQWSTEGLHGSYCRAVALDRATAFVSASTGPFTQRGSLYRCHLGGPLIRCAEGLPPTFPFNLDSGTLDARAGRVVLGTRTGELYQSKDAGTSWQRIAEGLPPITVVRLCEAV